MGFSEANRLDLLIDEWIHEFTHRLGYKRHDDAFVSMYHLLLKIYKQKLLENQLENEVTFSTKIHQTRIKVKGKTYYQYLIKIPKDKAEKFKGLDEVRVRLIKPI